MWIFLLRRPWRRSCKKIPINGLLSEFVRYKNAQRCIFTILCAKRNKLLAQYSAFIEKVRSFTKETGDKEAGMKAAIRYCREHDILKEFLGKNATEVMNMLLEEYTVEDAMALMRKESLEEGREEGREEGLEKGLERGRGEAVNNLLGYGMTPEQISQALKLPLETVIQYQAG